MFCHECEIVFNYTTHYRYHSHSITVQVAAVAIMAKYGIPTVDMHAAITSQCGPAPNATCFGQSTCFCPHCPQANGVGYEWLAANLIVPAIDKLLGR